jgi:hypothetical protein
MGHLDCRGEAEDIMAATAMDLDQTLEAEIRATAERLDRLIPKDGAHLAVGADGSGRSVVGSRLGYLRLGVEFLAAAMRPLPATDAEPARIAPDVEYLLGRGSPPPFDLYEIDEAIVSRPPVRSGLGALGELLAGVLAVAALIALFLAGAVAVRWLFG